MHFLRVPVSRAERIDLCMFMTSGCYSTYLDAKLQNAIASPKNTDSSYILVLMRALEFQYQNIVPDRFIYKLLEQKSEYFLKS